MTMRDINFRDTITKNIQILRTGSSEAVVTNDVVGEALRTRGGRK